MMRRLNRLPIGLAVLLAGCEGDPADIAQPDPAAEQNLQQKAAELEAAATKATDETQENVLEDQANTLRAAAEGEAAVDDEGSVTVVRE